MKRYLYHASVLNRLYVSGVNKKILFIATVAVLFLHAFFTPAYAYKCWKTTDALDNLDAADAVFTGEVVEVENVGVDLKELGTTRANVLFSIERIWKGLEDIDNEVYVDVESTYEYDFKVGKTYLVYAYRFSDNIRRLSMVGCPRVERISEVVHDVRHLGAPLYTIRVPSSEFIRIAVVTKETGRPPGELDNIDNVDTGDEEGGGGDTEEMNLPDISTDGGGGGGEESGDLEPDVTTLDAGVVDDPPEEKERDPDLPPIWTLEGQLEYNENEDILVEEKDFIDELENKLDDIEKNWDDEEIGVASPDDMDITADFKGLEEDLPGFFDSLK